MAPLSRFGGPRLGPMSSASAFPLPPDQTDRAILRAVWEEPFFTMPDCCDTLIINDATGALTFDALSAHGQLDFASPRVVSWTSSYRRARQLSQGFAEQIQSGALVVPSSDDPVSLENVARDCGGHVAYGRLPRSLSELDAIARSVARGYSEDDGIVCLALGGRTKHMTKSQNGVLAEAFTEVRAAHGVGKSRALMADGNRNDCPAPAVASAQVTLPMRGQQHTFELRGHGGVFGGASADAGSVLLLRALDQALPEFDSHVRQAVDLGCGNGMIASYLARALPRAQILASDDHSDAVFSTRDSLAANALSGERVRVTWDDAVSREPDESADLVVLNPPFHDGAAIDPTLVQGLLDAAARVLRPGGRLFFVHNSHLRYRPEVERRVGEVRELARDSRFTVLGAQTSRTR